ncbi:hypothetical protein VE03_08528 [Pseudogymnoascus sp. 23342-1-I1]|nr:hypothetical protein VE03_08528 [Pseudogymnoascus sp. 23342-1-I1]
MSNCNQYPSSAVSSNSSSSASLLSIPLTITSNSCPRCSDKLYLPPSIEALKSVIPPVDPSPVNRSIPRCVQCDKVNTERAAYFAQFPPPTHMDPVAELERRMLQIKDKITLNIEVEGMKIALDVAKKQKGAKEKERDVGIREAWKGYHGIWGPPRTG